MPRQAAALTPSASLGWNGKTLMSSEVASQPIGTAVGQLPAGTLPHVPSRRQNRLWRWAVDGFVFFWLITTSGAIFPLLTLGDGAELDEAARAKLRLLLLPSLAMAPILVLSRFRAVTTLLLRNHALWLIMFWIGLSVVWSFAPEVSSRRALGFAVNTLIACYLVVDRDFDSILRTLSWTLLLLLVASLVFIVGLPTLGAMLDGRGLRGAFIHKNLMGETIVLALIVFIAALRRGAWPRYLGVSGFALALALLVPVGAASSTVVALLVLAVHVYLLSERLRFDLRFMVLAFAAALGCLLIGLLVVNIETVFAAFGRDTTLTGRTDIWPYILHMSEQRPLLGYGYNCFWDVEAFAGYVMDRFQWSIPSTHNGYLETLLGLGWIGLGLALAFIATMAYRLITQARRLEAGLWTFALPILVYFLSLNITESSMFSSSSISWIIVVIAALQLTPRLEAIRSV